MKKFIAILIAIILMMPQPTYALRPRMSNNAAETIEIFCRKLVSYGLSTLVSSDDSMEFLPDEYIITERSAVLDSPIPIVTLPNGKRVGYITLLNRHLSAIVPVESDIDLYADAAGDCPLLIMLLSDAAGICYKFLKHVDSEIIDIRIHNTVQSLKKRQLTPEAIIFSPLKGLTSYSSAEYILNHFLGKEIVVIDREHIVAALATNKGWTIASDILPSFLLDDMGYVDAVDPIAPAIISSALWNKAAVALGSAA